MEDIQVVVGDQRLQSQISSLERLRSWVFCTSYFKLFQVCELV